MELRQLEYFVAVAEEANFTRAAARLHISQPGISAQIRQLEHDLGAVLIDRSSRTAGLTAAGEAALVHARAALAAAGAVRQSVEEVSGLLRGRLVVGAVTACTVTPLFDALAAFHRAHPGVEVTMVEDNSDRLVAFVRAGTADLALIGAAGDTPDGLGVLPVTEERLVAAFPPDHDLARRDRVTLEDVCAHPIVCLPVGTGIREVLDRACAAQGRTPNIALQAGAPSAVADLACRDLGVAVLSESMGLRYSGLLETAVIVDVDIPALLALVWKPAPSPAVAAMLKHCRQTFALSADTDTFPGVDAGQASPEWARH